jgi:hypothetical protein
MFTKTPEDFNDFSIKKSKLEGFLKVARRCGGLKVRAMPRAPSDRAPMRP